MHKCPPNGSCKKHLVRSCKKHLVRSCKKHLVRSAFLLRSQARLTYPWSHLGMKASQWFQRHNREPGDGGRATAVFKMLDDQPGTIPGTSCRRNYIALSPSVKVRSIIRTCFVTVVSQMERKDDALFFASYSVSRTFCPSGLWQHAGKDRHFGLWVKLGPVI